MFYNPVSQRVLKQFTMMSTFMTDIVADSLFLLLCSFCFVNVSFNQEIIYDNIEYTIIYNNIFQYRIFGKYGEEKNHA